jgi:hypothetical protein
MTKKTGSWLALSSLAVTALLWAAPAKAEDPWDACFVEYDDCVSQANGEPVDWIRDYSLQACEANLNACLRNNGYYN